MIWKNRLTRHAANGTIMYGGEFVRLFVAIDLSDEIKDTLVAVQDEMREKRIRGNYSKRENFHITLAFIGEYKDPDDVMDALGTVASDPFDISLEGLGSFGTLWWAGLAKSEHLTTLARRVRRALADAGIPFDKKRFSPHITLIRQPNADAIPGVAAPRGEMGVERFSLFRSDRGKSGVVYTEIGCINL